MAATFFSVLSDVTDELSLIRLELARSRLDLGYIGSKNVELKNFIREKVDEKHIVFLNPTKNFMNISSPQNLKKMGNVWVVILGPNLPKDLIGFLQEYQAVGFMAPQEINEATLNDIIQGINTRGFVANRHIPLDYWLNKMPYSFPRPKPDLTDGEEEVLRYLCHNFNVREIAEILDKKEPAIRAHIANLREKLYAKSLLEIVVITMANMWVRIDPSLTSGKNPFL